jgi:hypothetical protein
LKVVAVGLGVVVVSVAAIGLVVALRGRSGSAPTPLFSPPVLGAQPPGAVVLAGESRELAVALAVQPTERRKLLLVATALGQDGAGAGGLGVTFVVRGVRGPPVVLDATPGPLGTYAAKTSAVTRPAHVSIRIRGRGAGSTPLAFGLPATWPAPPAATIVARAQRAYKRIRTLVVHESLASDPIHRVDSVYREIAPNTLEATSSNGARAIIVGSRRWDRVGSEPWQSSTLTPFPAIRPFWVGLVQDASLLGTATVRSRAAWVVSFAAPQMPAFFTVWIDRRNDRTLRLRMTTAAHFMRHEYGPFDTPLTVTPP